MGLIKLIKNYRELGHDEFMRRLKEGVEKTSPLSQQKAQFWGHPFILLGIIAGIYITFRSKTYWLSAILFGSLILEVLALFGAYQRYFILKAQADFLDQLYNSQQEQSVSNDGQLLNSSNNSLTSFSSPADIQSQDEKSQGNSNSQLDNSQGKTKSVRAIASGESVPYSEHPDIQLNKRGGKKWTDKMQ